MKKYCITIASIIFCITIKAQDPSYSSFNSNRLLFNPSLVGATGAQSWKARLKTQWLRDGGSGYKTAGLLFEETMPCTILDGGIKINVNEEGQGLYRTVEAGLLSAITLPINSKYHDHNFKIGLDAAFGINSINYERLIWSDQLDPKEGPKLPTNFIAPNGGNSAWFFNPGFGVSLRSLWNKEKRNAVMTNFGIGMYRFWALKDKLTNQSISVLGLSNPNNLRFTFFGETEFVPISYGRKYISFRPLIFYQKQGELDYMELGFRAGYSKRAGISLYYHLSPNNELGQTKWITAGTDFQLKADERKLIELNLSFSQNIGGLQNFSGPQFEIGFTYHIRKSSICNILGLEDDVPYSNEYKCPIMAFTPGKRKMYENIWYKN